MLDCRCYIYKGTKQGIKVADDKRHNKILPKSDGHKQWTENAKFKRFTQEEIQQFRERERR